ncbi:hypothetical protein MKW92_001612 [Papaver armeniacum]|nr:hypothetical protein MKW92_001612 [Papaver armeniacum]
MERLVVFPSSSCLLTSALNPKTYPSSSQKLTPKKKQNPSWNLYASYEVGGGFPEEDFGGVKTLENAEKQDPEYYKALLDGGEQVTSVLEEMIKLLEDMNMNEASEEVAVEIAAQGVIGKRVDQMESGFMMALDYMIQLAEKDDDDQRKSLLEVIKQTVLSHLTKSAPTLIGLLCRTPKKESRHELLRRVAAGGGVFQTGNDGTKVQLPGANLNDIANQADDLLETMESRPVVPDRKLLARLVLIREEARNMMGGGILDERNDRGFTTLPEAEVNFLTKLVALRPGKTVEEMIRNCFWAAPLPVRPGMFLESVSRYAFVLGGIYSGNVSGITAQHLEWWFFYVKHLMDTILILPGSSEDLLILQEIAF